MDIPSLFLPISSGPHSPYRRNIYPLVVESGWNAYFAPVLDLVRSWKIPDVIVHLPHGLDYLKWPNGTAYRDNQGRFVARQDIGAWRSCLNDGLLNVTNTEEFRNSLLEIKDISADTKIHMYVGPYDDTRPPPTEDQIYEYFEPFISFERKHVDSVIIDGDSHFTRLKHRPHIKRSIEKLELEYGTEPIDFNAQEITSVTIASTYDFYANPEIRSLMPSTQYRKKHFWIDNTRNTIDFKFWEAMSFHQTNFNVAVPPQVFNYFGQISDIIS